MPVYEADIHVLSFGRAGRWGGLCGGQLSWKCLQSETCIRGIQSGFPAALKVPSDSQLLHHTLHLGPRSFSNTETLHTATCRAYIHQISVFTFPVRLRLDHSQMVKKKKSLSVFVFNVNDLVLMK